MPVEKVLTVEIRRISILDEQGRFDEELGRGLIDDGDVVRLYEHMVACRHYDEVAFKLQRSGRMGTYPENRGQEAASIGAVYALRPDDWIVPCYRENPGLFLRGLPMECVLLHWMGDERGNQIPRELFITPIAIPIGTQMLHAAGLAWAAKYRGEDRIACTFFGDGASSEGDCHEALNFAANLDLPVVFVCQNNGWAISVPSRIQCSAPTIAQRGVAYGMECVQVDGNDLFAVVKAVREAAARARKEKKPTFIEALTYRLGDHTTADDARRYRKPEEVEEWKKRDPLVRLHRYLVERRLWDDAKEQAAQARGREVVALAVKRAEEIVAPTPPDFFTNVFAEPCDEMDVQMRTMRTESLGQDPGQLEGASPSEEEHASL